MYVCNGSKNNNNNNNNKIAKKVHLPGEDQCLLLVAEDNVKLVVEVVVVQFHGGTSFCSV